MAKVTGFNYFRTESPSDNIRIKLILIKGTKKIKPYVSLKWRW